MENRSEADGSCWAGSSHFRSLFNCQCTKITSTHKYPYMRTQTYTHTLYSIHGHPEEHGKASPIWRQNVTEQDPHRRWLLRELWSTQQGGSQNILQGHLRSRSRGAQAYILREWGSDVREDQEGDQPQRDTLQSASILVPTGFRGSCKKSDTNAAWCVELLISGNA